MTEYKLKAKIRDLTVPTAVWRQQNIVPAEVYGHKKKNLHITVERPVFEKLWKEIGESNLIALAIGDEDPINVLIKSVQLDPVTDHPQHIDFYIVRMDEKLQTEIPLEFVGQSKAVKEFGGILVKNHNTLPVMCLPKDLVPKIYVELSLLQELNDVITIARIKIPKGIEVKLDEQAVICSVQPPKKVEEVKVEEEIDKGAEGEETAAAEGGGDKGDYSDAPIQSADAEVKK